jgi:hypothetical protein
MPIIGECQKPDGKLVEINPDQIAPAIDRVQLSSEG